MSNVIDLMTIKLADYQDRINLRYFDSRRWSLPQQLREIQVNTAKPKPTRKTRAKKVS
jgi:hypothetical protein